MRLVLGDYIVLGIIGLWLFLVVRNMIKRHRRGQSITCMSCSGCSKEKLCSKKLRH